MKKVIIKFLIIFISLFCIICLVNNSEVYAYNIYEVTEKSDFKVVENNQEPSKYDIKIDAQDLISNERLPSGMQTTMEDVLYNTKWWVLGVDFFGKTEETEDSNTDDLFKKGYEGVRDIVRNVYRVFLYIAAAGMFTVLIYMAVVIVTSGVSPKLEFLPFSKVINGKYQKIPEKEMKSKVIVEQWISSLFYLTIAIFVMNFIVGFSDNITNMMSEKRLESEKITVYVKNSRFQTDAPILGGTVTAVTTKEKSEKEKEEEAKERKASREKIVEEAKKLDKFGATNSEEWIEACYKKALGKSIKEQNCAHEAGMNADTSFSSKDYIEEGAAVFSYSSPSKTIDNACNKDMGQAGIYIGDNKIATYTGKGETGVEILTIDEWEKDYEFSCWGWIKGTGDLTDIKSKSASVDAYGKKYVTISYTFKTNLEGLLMFESQFNANSYTGKAVLCTLEGFALTFVKGAMVVILFVRMLLIAVISAFAPIIIVIDALAKINGNKGYLKNWLGFYSYLVLLRPAIAIVYYILIQSNMYLITEFPIYTLIVLIGIMIALFISIRKQWDALKRKKLLNIAIKNT